MVKRLVLFAIGGIIYMIIELLWRGWSHWSMFFLGGLCFVLVGSMNKLINLPLPVKAAAGAVSITLLEFVSGCVVNLYLHMDVWSYEGAPLNIMGQICLPYTLLWFILSFVCIFAYDILEKRLFDESG